MAYEKKDNALEEIETYSEGDLSSSSEFLTPDQYPIFWKELLKALQSLSGEGANEDGNEKENDVIKQKNITPESLLEYIEKKCDLPLDSKKDEGADIEIPIDENGDKRSIFLSKFYNQIKKEAKGRDTEDKFFWNESLEDAVRHFLNFFVFEDDQVLIQIPNGKDSTTHSITVGTIREADAGYSFNPAEWVRPFWNINDKSYNEVRGHDQVNDILGNDNKLQYTREKFKKDESGKYILDEDDNKIIDETYKWIRLLMPQYGRRVETEDLNRNWWVIAEVIAAISDFLFDDNSPIENMFDYFLRELTELWENMLYLWLEVVMASQKTNDGVRVIVLPLQADENRTDKRFDNFNDIISYTNIDANTEGWTIDGLKIYGKENQDEQKEAIFNHIKYLAEEYSEQNLCIIPYIRMENYKHNYYVGEYYPYIFIYNQKQGDYNNLEKWTIYSIKYRANELVISPKYDCLKLSEHICGFKYNKDEETYSYQYPFAKLEDTKPLSGENQTLLYGGIRTEVDINFEKNPTDIIINEIKINVYDAIRKGIDSADNKDGYLGQFSASKADDKNEIHFSFSSEGRCEDLKVDGIAKKDCYDIINAAYLGECATYWGKSMINYTADLTQISITCVNTGSTEDFDEEFDKFSDFLEDIEKGLKIVQKEGTDKSRLYTLWETKVNNTRIPINSAKFLYSHIVYRQQDKTTGNVSSFLECSPFISYIINDGGNYYYYHYIYKIDGDKSNPTINNLKNIAYPYTSSRYEDTDDVQYSTQLLCQYPWRGKVGENTVIPTSPTQSVSKSFQVYAPNNTRFVDNRFLPDWIDKFKDINSTEKRPGVPCGNLVYNKYSLRIEASGNKVNMSDFIICAQDRACAGASQVDDIFPYYYCCTISRPTDESGWGIITATIHLNEKSNALNKGEQIYTWSNDRHPYLRSYSQNDDNGGNGSLGINELAYTTQYDNIDSSIFDKDASTQIHPPNIETS